MLPAPATVGNKLVPDQAVNTTLEVLVQPVNESFASAFVECGPSINGYYRVVPPLHSVETVCNTIAVRQNAVNANEVIELNETSQKNVDAVVNEIVKYCHTDPVTMDDIIKAKNGPKKKIYQKAKEDII